MNWLFSRIDPQIAVSILLVVIGTAAVLTFSGPYAISIAVALLTWMYLCVSWNIIGGLVGQVSFGHAAFFGIGGYVSTYLATTYGVTPWIGMIVGATFAAIAAIAVGHLPFRRNLSPLVFALLTLAFAYVLEFGVSGISGLGGTNGLYAKAIGSTVWDMRFAEPGAFLVVIAAMLCTLLVVISVLYTGRLGFFWRAVHDNEAAAAAMGVNPFLVKQQALAISAFATALAGGFQAQFIGFIDPPSMFGIETTIFILLFTVVGGAGTLIGPLIGPLLLFPAGEVMRVYLQDHAGGALHHMLYGLALIVVILLCPGGIVAGLSRLGISRGRLRIPRAATGSSVKSAPASTPAAPGVLAVKGLRKVFGGLVAVDNVSFDVKCGEIFGVIGPNGAGKTTLFSMLGGFAKPTSGSVRFDGREIQTLAPFDVCRLGLARTFQITQAFPSLTVREVVVAAALVRNSEEEAVTLADDIVARMRLSERCNVKSADLTLAEQRRLEIARALATRPRLILLDEILGGLTPREADEAIDNIRSIRDSGITVLVIEHMVRAVMSLCDRIIVLDAGEAISLGTPQEISRDPRVIEAYLGDAA
ncbi:MAG: branched-chain amino acid ABC transporter ATP-binding protein [Bradyrhizobiaceae bacterium PARB1]|nr:MAG: branched-chain amino acid ABC transporter ATP-binding protein [Bradyrhizobiaceae bacterium PARB1]